MLISVKNSSGKFLAGLKVTAQNGVEFLGTTDPAFRRFVLESLDRGIERLVEVPGKDPGNYTTLVTQINQNDSLFPLAFKNYLERLGFDVGQRYLETEEEIKKLLGGFPQDPSKKAILDRLPEMSYLEQTFILEELKKNEK